MERRKFGDLAQAMGMLEPEQLTQALRIQEIEDCDGRPRRPLGLICMQEGFLSFEQVVAILEQQQKQHTVDL